MFDKNKAVWTQFQTDALMWPTVNCLCFVVVDVVCLFVFNYAWDQKGSIL